MKHLLLSIALAALCLAGYAQVGEIIAKKDFVFPENGYTFPKTAFDGYKRYKISVFNDDDQNISVNYSKEKGSKYTYISIYVYPAGEGIEGRLRDGFAGGMDAIFQNNNESQLEIVDLTDLKASNPAYTSNGFKCTLSIDEKKLTELVIFECGEWFYKLRITTTLLDMNGLNALTDKIITTYNPASLTSLAPLPMRVDIYYPDLILNDSTLHKAATEAVYTKIKWVETVVGLAEWQSGFPDIYLDMHVEALKTFVKIANALPEPSNPQAKQYIDELNEIIKAGYLTEFIIDQFTWLVRFSEQDDEDNYDMDGFQEWSGEREFIIDLQEGYATVIISRQNELDNLSEDE